MDRVTQDKGKPSQDSKLNLPEYVILCHEHVIPYNCYVILLTFSCDDCCQGITQPKDTKNQETLSSEPSEVWASRNNENIKTIQLLFWANQYSVIAAIKYTILTWYYVVDKKFWNVIFWLSCKRKLHWRRLQTKGKWATTHNDKI